MSRVAVNRVDHDESVSIRHPSCHRPALSVRRRVEPMAARPFPLIKVSRPRAASPGAGSGGYEYPRERHKSVALWFDVTVGGR